MDVRRCRRLACRADVESVSVTGLQIRRIVEGEDMPRVGERQTLLFSATFPKVSPPARCRI